MIIRQGDVLLEKVDELPKEAKVKDDKILAYGEVTGHHHRFEAPQVTCYTTEGDTQYAVLDQEATLLHEEHENLQIPKGIYKVKIQREFDLMTGIRQVYD